MEFDVGVKLDDHGWPAARGSAISGCTMAGAPVRGDVEGAREVRQPWLVVI